MCYARRALERKSSSIYPSTYPRALKPGHSGDALAGTRRTGAGALQPIDRSSEELAQRCVCQRTLRQAEMRPVSSPAAMAHQQGKAGRGRSQRSLRGRRPPNA